MPRQVETTFAQNFRLAQAQKGVTAEALARRIDVGLRVVQHWRAGTAEPRGGNLVALAEALGQEPGWFYIDHDDASPSVEKTEAAA